MRAHLSATAVIWFLPSSSSAHSFGTGYVLPIPLWMYVFGCTATLVLTFLVMTIVGKIPVGGRFARIVTVSTRGVPQELVRWAVVVLRGGALSCLLLTILAGFIGTQDATNNIGMTLFWVLFLLVLAYLTAFFGDIYSLINPWKLAVSGLQKVGLDLKIARVAYPERLAYWPAFFGYVTLVWFELFGGQEPVLLSIALAVYTAITMVGVFLFGKKVWFEKADAFSVLFRLIALLAPLRYCKSRGQRSYELELPLVRIPSVRTGHISLVLFVLFMLASTAYDSVHETVPWTAFFWSNALRLFQPLWGTDLARAQVMLMSWYLVYRQVGLLIFPFLYLGVYILVLLWTKAWTKAPDSLSVLAFKFCFSLIPIGLAYSAAHYFTFLVTQCLALPALGSDPFGLGWKLFQIHRNSTQVVLTMGFVWHTELMLILLGHVASVYLVHRTAMSELPKGNAAITGQVPLLALTIVYTAVSLGILSFPIG